MNVLITGGAGYLGSHTAAALFESGHEVTLLDNFSNSTPNVLKALSRICGKQLAFVEGDVRDTQLIKGILVSHNICGVLHFAGCKSVKDSVSNPISYYSNNVQGTISLLEAMLGTDVRTLVFSSSATVYGSPDYLPIDEDHPTRPVSPYGRSKLQVEAMLDDLAEANENWRIACLRYFNPVGAHDSGLIGDFPVGKPQNLMPFIAQVAASHRPSLDVFGSDYPTADGTGVRDYIHVLDLAKGHIAALNFLSRNRGCHLFNLGSGTGYSVLDILKTFEMVSKKKIPYVCNSRRAGDVAKIYANYSRASHQLKWKPERNLESMCESAWRFQMSINSEPKGD